MHPNKEHACLYYSKAHCIITLCWFTQRSTAVQLCFYENAQILSVNVSNELLYTVIAKENHCRA